MTGRTVFGRKRKSWSRITVTLANGREIEVVSTSYAHAPGYLFYVTLARQTAVISAMVAVFWRICSAGVEYQRTIERFSSP